MHLQKSIGWIVCVIGLILFSISTVSSANNDEKQLVKVGVRISGSGALTELDKKIKQYFKNEVDKRAVYSEEPVFEFFINSETINKNENEIVLSVIATIKLPEEVIKLGKKNEIFYSIRGSKNKWKNLPKEGKFIREYVTEEYLKQFNDIYEHEIYIIPETKLEEQCKKIIDDFFRKYLPMKGEPK